MDIIAAYREAGTYRGAAEIAGTTHKTVRRVIARHVARGAAPERAARAAGYTGSDRNFRRLVAEAKLAWRRDHHRGGRPAVWSPAEHLVIDWVPWAGCTCSAVLAWSRFRFVRFAADERAETTMGMLAECFEGLGGVPGKVLADRMGCLKGGIVANVVVPTGQYVRFAAHYGFSELDHFLYVCHVMQFLLTFPSRVPSQSGEVSERRAGRPDSSSRAALRYLSRSTIGT
jgi:hypothetical protein